MSTIKGAINLAEQAHEGQSRYDGSPYVNHPLRVMGTVATQGYSEIVQVVAVMHDVVEDSDFTLKDLQERGFSPEAVSALELLTKRPGADYWEYLAAIAINPIARAVKRADLFDNMDLSGLELRQLKHSQRLKKYSEALLYLSRFS